MKLFHILIISLFLLVNLISIGCCQDVTLSWDPSPTEGVTGYKVYYKQGDMNYPFNGTGADQGSSPVDVGDTLSTTLTNLSDDSVFFFTVTAYVTSDQESSFSNIVSNSWIPALLLPVDGATEEPVPVTFQWETAPTGYDVSYTLFYGTNRDEVVAAKAIPVAVPPTDRHLPQQTPFLLIFTLLLCLIYLLNNRIVRYREQIAIITALIVIGGGLTACGGGGGGDSASVDHSATDPTTPSATLYSVDKGSSDYHQAFNLDGATTYYWKVVATDTQDHNLTYESETLQFTTESF